jgi:hypothetical protein
MDTRSSDQIRRDLEGARSELHHTVDALEHRLSPGQVVDEIWGRMRGSADGGAMRAFGHVVRSHRAPAALIGLGLAWMAVERTGAGRSEEVAAGAGGPTGSDESSGMDRVKSGASSVLGSAGGKAQEVADRVAGKVKAGASGAAATVRGGVKERMAGARERAAGWRERAGERIRGDGSGGWSLRWSIDNQPLAAGAVTFGLGLAAGLIVPSTSKEDQLMGPAADAVKDEALRTTKDVAESAKSVAEDVAEAVKEEAREQDVPGRLKEAAEEIGRVAKEEARERAGEEDIDPEGIRRRAARAGEEIRRRGRDSHE